MVHSQNFALSIVQNVNLWRKFYLALEIFCQIIRFETILCRMTQKELQCDSIFTNSNLVRWEFDIHARVGFKKILQIPLPIRFTEFFNEYQNGSGLCQQDKIRFNTWNFHSNKNSERINLNLCQINFQSEIRSSAIDCENWIWKIIIKCFFKIFA